MALRARLDQLTQSAQFLVAEKTGRPMVTEVLAELTRLVPDQAHIVQLELRDGSVQLHGYAATASELIGLLDQSQLFKTPQFRSPVTQDPRSGSERFHLSVELAARGGQLMLQPGSLLSRTLAVVLLGVALLGGVRLVVAPLLAAWRDAAAEIEEAEFLLQRYRALAEQRRAMAERLAEQQELAASAAGYLQGPSDALAAAQLQDRVKTVVERAGGELRSTQILPATPVEVDAAIRRAALRVQFVVTIAGLAETLYELETGQPYLLIDELTVREQRTRRRRRDEPESEAQPRRQPGAVRLSAGGADLSRLRWRRDLGKSCWVAGANHYVYLRHAPGGARPDIGERRHGRTIGWLVDWLLAADLRRRWPRWSGSSCRAACRSRPQVTAAPPPAPLPEAGPRRRASRRRPKASSTRSRCGRCSSNRDGRSSRRRSTPRPRSRRPPRRVAVELIGTLVTDQRSRRAAAARGRAGGLASRGRQDRRLERARDRARPGHPAAGRGDRDARAARRSGGPLKPARSAGKRKRGERAAQREAAAEPAGQASPPKQSSSQ